MTKNHRLALSLVASILVAGWALPASAADQAVQPAPPVTTAAPPASAPQVTPPPPVTPPPKVVTVTPKKSVRHHFVRVASAEVPPIAPIGLRIFFPLMLGVGF